MSKKAGFLEWASRRINSDIGSKNLIPDALFAACPQQLPPGLPYEVALLLPIQKVRDPVPDNLSNPSTIAAALFLANPLINTQIWMRHLRDRDVGWVANFPTVTQHEQGFRDRLTDVGLGFEKELSLLSDFGDYGFRILACVTSAEDAAEALKSGCHALLVLPKVSAFEGGFPSVQNRQSQLLQIRSAITDTNVPILGLLQPAEAALTSTWPKGMEAGMVRPSGPSLS